jgi:hypothetical protein
LHTFDYTWLPWLVGFDVHFGKFIVHMVTLTSSNAHDRSSNVATLTLGLWPRQSLAKVQTKKEPVNHISCSRVQESVREWTPTLPSELPLWELESQWTLESSKGDCRGQNSLDWKVLYIIGKPLEFRCLNGLAGPCE